MQRLTFWLQSRRRLIGQWFSFQLEDTKPSNSIAALDGVRAIAILLVVFYHVSLLTARTNIWAPNAPAHPLFSTVALAGASGVTLFFVLSGFLLFRPYAKALLGGSSWPPARLFYLRRSFRIIPAYYVCLFVIILLNQQQYLQRVHWRELALFLTFFMDSTYRTNHQLNGPFWTLAVEWQYYLILPLIALAISWVVKRGPVKLRLWNVAFCLVGLIGWGLFTRYWGMYFATYPARSFLVPRSVLNIVLFFSYGASGKYLEDFAIGMGISAFYVYTQNHAADHPCNMMMRRLSHWLWQIGIIVLVFLALWHFDNIAYNSWPFLNKLARSGYWLNYYDWLSELCLAIGFGLCITAILYWPMKVQRPFAWAPLRSIGLISYSMYMWHLPLILIFLNYVGKHLKGWNIALVFGMYWGWVALIVVPFSFLMFMLVEKPWMRLGERFRQPSRKPEIEVSAGENLKM